MSDLSFDNEHCFESILKNLICVHSTMFWDDLPEWLGVHPASGTSETKTMLGLLSPLYFSLPVGRILPISDVLPSRGWEQEVMATGCFKLVTPPTPWEEGAPSCAGTTQVPAWVTCPPLWLRACVIPMTDELGLEVGATQSGGQGESAIVPQRSRSVATKTLKMRPGRWKK